MTVHHPTYSAALHGPQLFPRAAAAFRKFLLRAVNSDLIELLMGLSEEHGGYCEPIEQLLYGYLAEYVTQHYDSEVARYKGQVSTLDMRAPHTWWGSGVLILLLTWVLCGLSGVVRCQA